MSSISLSDRFQPFVDTRTGAGVAQVVAWVTAARAGLDRRSGRPAWGTPAHHHT